MVLLVSSLLALKGILLATFGPAVMPDTGGYEGYANLILGHELAAETLSAGPMPITAFRIAGLPLVIALLKTAAGGAWPWALAVLQAIASIGATAMLHVTARSFGLGRWGCLAVALAHATGQVLVLDQAALTDSLYTTLIILTLCTVGRAAVQTRPLGASLALVSGLLLAGAFLLREATGVLFLTFVPLVAIAAIRAGGDIPHWRRWLHGALCLALFATPLQAVQMAYKGWNKDRLGAPVVTTGAQTTLLQALAIAARHEPRLFSSQEPLDRAARKHFQTYEFEEVVAINATLFHEYGITADKISAENYRRYFNAWRAYPLAMAQVPLKHLRANQAQMTVRPMETIRELILWTKGNDNGFARWKTVREGNWVMLPVVLLDLASKAVAIAVFAAFTLLTPWRLLRGDRSRPVIASAGLWIVYFGFLAAYGLVHLETRYMAPVVPMSLLAGSLNLVWAWNRRKSP